MLAEYVEVIEEKEHIELTKEEVNKFIANRDITYILDLYGAYNRSGLDNIGHARVAMGFKHLLVECKSAEVCSEDDAIVIDSILLRLDRSSDPEKRAMSNIIKMYYIGVNDKDVCNPVPLKNIKMIGDLIGCGETKTKKLKETAENYICGSLDAMDRVLDCELYLTINNI